MYIDAQTCTGIDDQDKQRREQTNREPWKKHVCELLCTVYIRMYINLGNQWLN